MDKAIRILVANRPKLMRELLLGTLADQPWIEIVGEVSDDAEIPAHVQKTLPDLLVIAVDEPGSLLTKTTPFVIGRRWIFIPTTLRPPRRVS